MSLKGHLGTIALPELLQWLAIGQKTGTLVIVKEDGVHRVVVDRGRIISTSTSDPGLQLGPWLRQAGLVDEPTLERARKLREATGMSLGRVLLTLQAVPEEDLRDALRDKAEALISALFHSTTASFQFVEDGDLGDPGVALSLDATQLVLSAAHNLEQRPGSKTGSAAPADPRRPAAAKKGAPVGPRPTPKKATATVIETLPEHAMPGPEPATATVAEPEPAGRGRRRAIGGLTAAAALVAALGVVLMIGRSHVPAKAEESAQRAAAMVGAAAPLAAGDLAARPAGGPPAASAGAAGVEAPIPAAAVAGDGDAAAAREDEALRAEEARLEALVAQREAELRDELDSRYREELAALRRQLAERERRAVGPAVATTAEADPTGGGPGAAEAVVEPAPVAAAEPETLAPDTAGAAPLPVVRVPSSPAAEPAAAEPAATEPAATRPAATQPGAAAPASTPARLVSRPAPTYPPAALRLGRSAVVTVRVLVGANGEVVEVETAGRKAGMGFDDAARAAARRSRWLPATENGVPVESWVDLRFEFERP